MSFLVPTVTEDDLAAFHKNHFARCRVPVSFFQNYDTSGSQAPEETIEDLGYYPDGVQRTLTDDQITMFRHSEIEALLRERRHRQEAEADGEVLPVQNSGAPTVAQNDAISDGEIASEVLDTEQRPRKRPKKNKNKKGHAKRQMYHPTQPAEDFTPNRMAREQDEVQHASVELDY